MLLNLISEATVVELNRKIGPAVKHASETSAAVAPTPGGPEILCHQMFPEAPLCQLSAK